MTDLIIVAKEDFPLKGSHFQKSLSDANQIKLPFLRVWDMCSLFLQGKQHLRYNRTLKILLVRSSHQSASR